MSTHLKAIFPFGVPNCISIPFHGLVGIVLSAFMLIFRIKKYCSRKVLFPHAHVYNKKGSRPHLIV